MFVILFVIMSTVVLTSALLPLVTVERGDEKIKEVIGKYIAKVPDISEQYIVDERLSRAITQYFKGKLSSFPLFKVSVKIDRNPVKIPWTLGEPNATIAEKPRASKKNNKQVKKRYKVEKTAKRIQGNNTRTTTEKPVEKKVATTIESLVTTI